MLRPYVEGLRFTIGTDHYALRWILKMADTTVKIARWRLRLQERQFDVWHRAGIKHEAADDLSRLGKTVEDRVELKDEFLVLIIEARMKHDETSMVYSTSARRNNVTPEIPEVMKINIDELVTPQLEQCLRKQSTNPDFQSISTTVGTPGPVYYYD